MHPPGTRCRKGSVIWMDLSRQRYLSAWQRRKVGELIRRGDDPPATLTAEGRRKRIEARARERLTAEK
jgi:hypothetical protein